ncbi:hypothetical protein ACLKA6_000492 [Drosophila palustris]
MNASSVRMSGIKQEQEQEQEQDKVKGEQEEGEEQSGELSPPPFARTVSCGPFATCCGNRGVINSPSLCLPPISIVIPVTSNISKRSNFPN